MLARDVGDLRLAQRTGGHCPRLSGVAAGAGTVHLMARFGGVERPRRKERFARLIHRGVRALGGSSARAAFGGNLKPALVATQGDMAERGP